MAYTRLKIRTIKIQNLSFTHTHGKEGQTLCLLLQLIPFSLRLFRKSKINCFKKTPHNFFFDKL